MGDTELVVVRTFNNPFEADVAKSALEAAGIDSYVRSDDANGTQPGLWMGQGVDLIVRAEDVTAATDILSTDVGQ